MPGSSIRSVQKIPVTNMNNFSSRIPVLIWILRQVTLRAFENELGVQEPVGFWDPAGFTADGSVENFKRRRQTELKHGRISMLATMGYITPETLSFFNFGVCVCFVFSTRLWNVVNVFPCLCFPCLCIGCLCDMLS